MKKLIPLVLSLVFLGTACGNEAKDGRVARSSTTTSSTLPPTEATPPPPEGDVPLTLSARQETSTTSTARPTISATVRSSTTTTTRPMATDDDPVPDVFRPVTDPEEPVSTTTTTRPTITPTTTTTRPVATTTTTTTTRPAPKGEVVAESSEHMVWNSGDPPCKPVQVILLNRSDTRVISVDITFYLYDFPSGVTNYWEGPYRKFVSIPPDNGTRAPYQVTVDVCPRRDGHRWSTHPNHPNYPAGVQLTWRWEGP